MEHTLQLLRPGAQMNPLLIVLCYRLGPNVPADQEEGSRRSAATNMWHRIVFESHHTRNEVSGYAMFHDSIIGSARLGNRYPIHNLGTHSDP